MEIGKGHLPIGDEKKGGILSKRTKSSLSTENFVLLPDITLPPTYLRCELISNLGDYGKKASMEKACKKRQS
jgi:hypothetical protein